MQSFFGSDLTTGQLIGAWRHLRHTTPPETFSSPHFSALCDAIRSRGLAQSCPVICDYLAPYCAQACLSYRKEQAELGVLFSLSLSCLRLVCSLTNLFTGLRLSLSLSPACVCV